MKNCTCGGVIEKKGDKYVCQSCMNQYDLNGNLVGKYKEEKDDSKEEYDSKEEKKYIKLIEKIKKQDINKVNSLVEKILKKIRFCNIFHKFKCDDDIYNYYAVLNAILPLLKNVDNVTGKVSDDLQKLLDELKKHNYNYVYEGLDRIIKHFSTLNISYRNTSVIELLKKFKDECQDKDANSPYSITNRINTILYYAENKKSSQKIKVEAASNLNKINNDTFNIQTASKDLNLKEIKDAGIRNEVSTKEFAEEYAEYKEINKKASLLKLNLTKILNEEPIDLTYEDYVDLDDKQQDLLTLGDSKEIKVEADDLTKEQNITISKLVNTRKHVEELVKYKCCFLKSDKLGKFHILVNSKDNQWKELRDNKDNLQDLIHKIYSMTSEKIHFNDTSKPTEIDEDLIEQFEKVYEKNKVPESCDKYVKFITNYCKMTIKDFGKENYKFKDIIETFNSEEENINELPMLTSHTVENESQQYYYKNKYKEHDKKLQDQEKAINGYKGKIDIVLSTIIQNLDYVENKYNEEYTSNVRKNVATIFVNDYDLVKDESTNEQMIKKCFGYYIYNKLLEVKEEIKNRNSHFEKDGNNNNYHKNSNYENHNNYYHKNPNYEKHGNYHKNTNSDNQ